ncbi:MAG: hypothetical protein QOG30_198 [Acidimicrobiaceae bacterium]
MCVICDGGSEEDLLNDEFVRVAVEGFVMVGVESESPWIYTIGLLQSYDHPELVVTGQAEEGAKLIVRVVDRIKEGQRFNAASPPTTLCCGCTIASFGSVHPEHWNRGRFEQWVRYYGFHGGEPAERMAVQVLWRDRNDLFPTDPEFCPAHRGSCQPLLDEAPRHDVHTGLNREQRRQAKRGHGKRRRR